MRKFLTRLFAPKTTPATRRANLGLETLGRRDVPAIFMSGSEIHVTCGSANDRVDVTVNTLYDEIWVTRKVGTTVIEQESFLRNPIDFGFGTPQPKPTKVVCNLGEGTNTFVNSTSLPSSVAGGSGRDVMHGGSGADTLRGGGGGDELYGNNGPDRLYGGSGSDYMDGGKGRDWMYGGTETDVLKGGDGVDGLYGGGGSDVLDGGGGSDRFLLSNANPDPILGYNDAQDVKVFLADVTGTAANDGVTYGAGYWSETEVETVDRALAALHERVGNNTLLKHDGGLFDSDYFTVFQAGTKQSGSGGFDGWNDGGGNITLTASAFSDTGNTLQTLIHEIGHDWDDEFAFGHGFLGLSGWTEDNPYSASYVKVSADGAYGEDWWRLRVVGGAGFASDYAMTNPYDDFAESFAAYFLDYMGATHSATGWRGEGSAAAKMNWMDDSFLDIFTIPID